MTTKLKGLTVAFDEDIREDDAEQIINAIQMIKGVLNVTPIETSYEDYIIEQRVRNDIFLKVRNIILKEG